MWDKRAAFLIVAVILAVNIADGRRLTSGLLRGGSTFSVPFAALTDIPSGKMGPAAVSLPVSTSSSSIAAIRGGALVADPDGGALVRVNADGVPTARLPIAGASQLAIDEDRQRAYVTDRIGDRIAVVSFHNGLTQLASWSTPKEPYAAALTPDGRFLLVVAIANRTLVAFDTNLGSVAWRRALAAEPRGLAISRDGDAAVVTFLSTSAVATIDLRAGVVGAPRYVTIGRPNVATKPTLSRHARGDGLTGLAINNQVGAGAAPLGHQRISQHFQEKAQFGLSAPAAPAAFARGSFAATFLPSGVAVAPYHRATPVQNRSRASAGTYGGGQRGNPPIVHRLAFVTPDGKTGRAAIDVRVPRALAYDDRRDLLFVAGKGDDKIAVIADASTPTPYFAGALQLRAQIGKRLASTVGKHEDGKPMTGSRVAALANDLVFSQRCGPGGMAISDAGDLIIHCQLSQRIVRADLDSKRASLTALGPRFGGSNITKAAQRGRELFFRAADARMSSNGAFACASCHPEARADGLSWRIGTTTLQTPLLAGRLVGTHPFKWDGGDKNLKTSLRQTVKRLGGAGIRARDSRDLAAYLESLPPPRAPTPADADAAARGKELFASRNTGCASCHRGEAFTDGQSHDLATNLAAVNTPSLLGLAHSAPYYHDGSAATLEALVLENGSVHGMGRTNHLDAGQRRDLIAYLETL